MATSKHRPGPKPLGEQIRDVLDARGLSMTQAAEMAGVDRKVVSRWYNGTRGLTLASAEAIATALGLRLVETARGRRR